MLSATPTTRTLAIFRCSSNTAAAVRIGVTGTAAHSSVTMRNSPLLLVGLGWVASAFQSGAWTKRNPIPPPLRMQQFEVMEADDVRRRQFLATMLAAATLRPPHGVAADVPAATATTVSDATILKPPLDDRLYRALTLPNGLRVLLCQDSSTAEAAAAMDVHVGASTDPLPGLAHFNEHMLFLGTQKYPKEDSFEAFLANHAGSSNAYTAAEDTVYYMDLEATESLPEALDRFASFFVAPLFTESATSREVNAIDSEHAKNLQSDAFRTFQIQKSRSNPQHPHSQFYTGNKETLVGPNLRNELIQFWQNYYSANQMTLAVVGPQALDELQSMVSKSFGDIPNRGGDKPELAWKGVRPYDAAALSLIPSFGHVVEIVPVQDLRQVQISWPHSYQNRTSALVTKPTSYVAHLLGHEGPNSLLSYLKHQGWATSLAVANEEELSDFEMLEVVVGLTTSGLSAVDRVVQAVYSYIEFMRKERVPAYVWTEVLQLEELSWRFSTKGSPKSYVTSLATSMQLYPPEWYVAGPRRLALDYDPAPRVQFASREQLDETKTQVNELLDSLTVENALVTVQSKTFEGLSDQRERWYGTDFRVRPIPESTLKSWTECPPARKLKMAYPKPNAFIPSEAGLVVKQIPVRQVLERTFESKLEPVPPPRVIRDDGPEGRWTVYYKQDDRFGLPKAYLIFQILTKEVQSTAEGAALGNLFELCISDRLGEFAYDAELAGLTYDVKILPRGIRLTFGGYNEKLQKFASYISSKLANDFRAILPKTDVEFERYKDQVMRALSAFDVKQPYAHASYYGQLTLQPRRFQYRNREIRDATRKLTLPDLTEYVNRIWESGKGEALVQGNIDEAEALEMVSTIGDTIKFKAIPRSECPPRLEALPLPRSNALSLPARLVISEPNPFNENAASYVMVQCLGTSEREHVLAELVSAIVQEPFYNDLRTKQQLGYIVSSGLRGVGESRTISFIVQSSVAPAESLTVSILAFLDSVEETLLKKIPKADLAVYVKSIFDRKTEPDKDLTTEVTRNWSEISSGRLQFDRLQQEAAALLDIEKDEVLDFWRRVYAGNGRRVLITEMVPRQGKASSDDPLTSTRYTASRLDQEGLTLGIDDIQQFRSDREKAMVSS